MKNSNLKAGGTFLATAGVVLRSQGLFLSVLGAALILAAALAYEQITGLQPCPLCWLQRGVFAAFFLFGLAVLLVRKLAASSWSVRKGMRWVAAAGFAVLTVAGAGIAVRHIYIKLNPASASCGLDVATLLDFFPLQTALTEMLKGSADCAQAANLLLLPLPVWSLGGYLILSFVAIYSLLNPTTKV